MSTPADQLQIPQQQPPQSPLDQYMAQYGQQLQSMLAGDPNGGAAPADPGMDAAGRTSDLGPDLYRPQPVNMPPQSALAAPQGQGPGSAAPQGQTPAGPPQSALAGAKGAQAPAAADSGGQGDSFRDLFKGQSKDTREKYVQQLQDHLKQADKTIDSAYSDMMDKMGGRPDKSLSKEQKGMLLMEFGMRMMEHSRPQYGQTNSTAGAIGQAGTETLQSAKGMQAVNAGQQQRYDQMQQQLTIAQGKEKAQLASRSALEEGRDTRAYGQQNSMLDRTRLQQEGANLRNANTVEGAGDRNANTVSGANTRSAARIAAANSGVTRTVTASDGSTYGLTKSGQMIPLKDASGTQIKAAPGGSGGPKQSAAQANFGLYMSTYGTDKDGKPLEGEDLKNAQGEALKYAANPRTYQLSEPQARQMAEKSADSFIRANPTSWMGMSPEEVQQHHDDYAEQEYTRIKRGGSATPLATPHSALGATAPGAAGGAATPPSPPGAPKPAGASPGAPGASGQIPTQPQPGGKAPNAKQLQLLNSNPKQNAGFFLQRFGYLPKEYQSFVQPQSALSR